MKEGDSVPIDIEQLAYSIKNTGPDDHLLLSTKCCIFRTPTILFRKNEKAYVPDAFSIGPLYHGKENLKATEIIKVKYFERLISRSDKMLSTIINSVAKVEKEARECYNEAIKFNTEELVKILVIDGCFIIELLLKNKDKKLREKDDPIFNRPCMLQFLHHDLILLENQVPWIVLEPLFNLITDSSQHETLITLSREFMKTAFLSREMPSLEKCINLKGIKHYVDLFRKLSISITSPLPADRDINIEESKHCVGVFRKLATLVRSQFKKWMKSTITEENTGRLPGWQLLPCAKDLVNAGIKFKRGSPDNVLDIKFIDGVLEIPPLQVHNITETVLRNLISYEQCQLKLSARITSYALLLACLISSPSDMNILYENEIIDNWLTSTDATELFKKLNYDAHFRIFPYKKLCKDVYEYRHRRWPRWRALFVRNYFDTPWAILSTSAAVILLILTFVQTWFDIRSK